jgi:Arc/MetJ-type ribon-helix-helix transcriptional regulator
MHTTSGPSPKTKITVRLSPELVRQIDALNDTPKAASRSRLVEEAVRLWLYDQAQKELELQTEGYYLSVSKAQRKEDKQWSKIAARSAKRLWGRY